MFNPRNVHVVLIGYDKTIPQYRINIELLRHNLSFGKELWITTVFNGDLDLLPSGVGENNFIKIPEDRGYAFGALDSINEGLSFAANFNRDIVMLFNFDVLWFTEEGFVKAIEDFSREVDNLGKAFSSAVDTNGLVATDCMIFDRGLLKSLNLPISPIYAKYREGLEIADRYKDTKLGFNNVEEWVWSRLFDTCKSSDKKYESSEEQDNDFRNSLLKNHWHKMARIDLPRLRFSEELALAHEHDLKEIVNKLNYYDCKGSMIVKHLRENGA